MTAQPASLLASCISSVGIVLGVLGLLAIFLAGCSQPGTVAGSVTPREDQSVTLVIHVEPAKALVDAHRTDGRTGAARPFTYRVESHGRLTCGIVFDDSVMEPTPAALARLQWEWRNCEGHGGDFPE